MTRATLPQGIDRENPPADPLQFAVASRDGDVLNLVRDALAAKNARLAFQPVVLAQNPRKVAFYEGLIRVMDDGGRVIPAGGRIPSGCRVKLATIFS